MCFGRLLTKGRLDSVTWQVLQSQQMWTGPLAISGTWSKSHPASGQSFFLPPFLNKNAIRMASMTPSCVSNLWLSSRFFFSFKFFDCIKKLKHFKVSQMSFPHCDLLHQAFFFPVSVSNYQLYVCPKRYGSFQCLWKKWYKEEEKQKRKQDTEVHKYHSMPKLSNSNCLKVELISKVDN